MANSTSSVMRPNVLQSLERARNCEENDDDRIILDNAVTELWRRVQSQPDTYVFTPDEFALFNYFIARFQGSLVTRGAVARFWDNYRRNGSGLD
ncbi:hypothetical protein BDV37DRAFT_276834 [Aspergillus pseudonomiae]|uniref:Uncharacterized protein n=1 Tax=Aspergillus pseudonomiae TaxID=1506151 RepID=A0A5N7CV17_9EURO|nr:uncharacterized protein BDV37DRAFT_276834 [Aspergillus pseudonomiae]KAE8397567.1 hypothetical protein BDV37DRAFT_276834 [Aspergillus pseudonomiae]